MRVYRVVAVVLPLTFIAVLFTACQTSQVANPGSPPVLSTTWESAPGVLVTIDFPATIDPAAYNAVRAKWKMHNMQTGHLIGTYQSKYPVEPAIDGVINEQLSKSAYYAALLYQRLCEILPADRVVLQPRVVTISDEGEVFYQPVPGGDMPSALYIDIFIHTVLYRAIEGRAWYPDTFGTDFHPVCAIFDEPAREGTYRRPLAATRAPGETPSGDVAPNTFTGEMNHKLPFEMEKGFTYKKLNRPYTGKGFFGFGWMGFTAQEEDVRQWIQSDRLSDFPHLDVFNLFSYVVVDALKVHPDLVTNATRDYLTIYDPQLASDFAADPMSVEKSKSYGIFRECAQVERTMLRELNQRFTEGLISGDFGTSMQDILSAELDFEKQMIRLRNQYTMMAFASAATSITSNVYTAQGKITPQQNLNVQMQLITNLSNQMTIQQDGLRQIAQLFDDQFNRATGAQREYVIRLAGSSERITAHDFATLREKARNVYRRFAIGE